MIIRYVSMSGCQLKISSQGLLFNLKGKNSEKFDFDLFEIAYNILGTRKTENLSYTYTNNTWHEKNT